MRPAISSTPVTWLPVQATPALAIILIDARKGVIEQTTRHSFLVSLLQIPTVVVAVNKMDMVDYSEEVFNQIVADFKKWPPKLIWIMLPTSR
jgi:sulfate adenylyltransferase subunit 1 (EFTu-like GTPase family)